MYFSNNPEDPALVLMKGIETEFKTCDDIDEKTCADADGEAQRIYHRKDFIPSDVSESDFEVVF